MKRLSDKLTELKKEHCLSFRDLAKRTGLSIGFMSDLNKGNRDPSPITIIKLERVYNCDLKNYYINEQKIKLQAKIEKLEKVEEK